MTLIFQDISFRYRAKAKPVLQAFFWQAPPGRTVLLGPNGAGKSTLLALGANALRPRTGSVHFNVLDPARWRQRAAYRRTVGWMPQQIRAISGMTTQEQVAYAGWLKGLSRREAWDAAAQAIDRVGLADKASEKVTTLSGGQLRRVGLAQVLVHRPRVLLLDEPTVGLDPAQRARFRAVLTELPEKAPIVVSTHQVDDLSELFDTVVVIEHGTIKFQGSVGAFLALAPASFGERRAEAAYTSLISGEQ